MRCGKMVHRKATKYFTERVVYNVDIFCDFEWYLQLLAVDIEWLECMNRIVVAKPFTFHDIFTFVICDRCCQWD